VNFSRWELYAASLYVEFEAQPDFARRDFFRDFGRFRDFVKDTPAGERVPLLIFAYERYRAPAPEGDSEAQVFFWRSAYAALIGNLLAAKLQPSEADACRILRHACPIDGRPEDLLVPIDAAERAFRHRLYAPDLFTAARTYRERLAGVRGSKASAARSRLDLMLWHDVRQPSRGCWTARIQRAIAGMDESEAFLWQWLLRNVSRGLWKSAGKTWREEAQRRFVELGEDRFLRRLDEWFDFPPGERLRLSRPGSQMLCLLVLYAGLANTTRSLPILQRLAEVRWSQRERMQLLVEALGRL
jgi:hypothetical protein